MLSTNVRGGVIRRNRKQPRRSGGIRIGLVNNMPDPALELTEQHFSALLARAMPDHAVELCFFSLSGVPRGEHGQRLLHEHGYRDVEELNAGELDGVIVTGTEPKSANLRAEPYWKSFSSFCAWIDDTGLSAVFSCLAAHAAVLHYDGIERHRLEDKCCGLFSHSIRISHFLTEGMPSPALIAHSRWHEVSAGSLAARGYRILSAAPDAGVDLFIRQRRGLQLFFQGHPEYDQDALLREYRRDVKRFLRREGEVYPRLPFGYFEPTDIEKLCTFRARARYDRSESLMDEFPELTARVPEVEPPSASIYRAWLTYIIERRLECSRSQPARARRSAAAAAT